MLTQPDVLRQQLEPLHEASTDIALSSLLPAILVAWADGVVQEKERRLIRSRSRSTPSLVFVRVAALLAAASPRLTGLGGSS